MGFLVCLNKLNVWALLHCSADTSSRECVHWQVASLWEVMHTGAVELPSFSIYRLGTKYVCTYTQADNTRSVRLSCQKKVLNSHYYFLWSIVCKQINSCSVMIDGAIGCIPSRMVECLYDTSINYSIVLLPSPGNSLSKNAINFMKRKSQCEMSRYSQRHVKKWHEFTELHK